MGAFYVNLSLRDVSSAEVYRYVVEKGRDAIVAPTVNRVTVVFDRECDSQDVAIIQELAADLSRCFDCVAWAVLIHDDDVFCYWLYARGEMLDEYNSHPSYLDPDASADPAGGNADVLCHEFDCAERAADAERILRAPPADRFALATQRHRDLSELLGLPPWCVSTGFLDLNAAPNLPPGFMDTLDAADP